MPGEDHLDNGEQVSSSPSGHSLVVSIGHVYLLQQQTETPKMCLKLNFPRCSLDPCILRVPRLHSSSSNLQAGLLPPTLPSKMLDTLALPILPLSAPLPALLLHILFDFPSLGCLKRCLSLCCAFICFAADNFSRFDLSSL